MKILFSSDSNHIFCGSLLKKIGEGGKFYLFEIKTNLSYISEAKNTLGIHNKSNFQKSLNAL